MATPKTYLDTIKSFADVPITADGVETASLLEAGDGIANALDLFEIEALYFVQADLRSKIEGVRSRFLSHQEASTTIDKLVTSEAQEGGRRSTDCIIYLMRVATFFHRALEALQADPTSELRACLKQTYDELGKPYQSSIMQAVVALIFKAVPSRSEFYKRLSQGAPYEELDTALSKTLKGVGLIIDHLKRFLEEGGYVTV